MLGLLGKSLLLDRIFQALNENAGIQVIFPALLADATVV